MRLPEKDLELIEEVTQRSQEPHNWLAHEVIYNLLDIITRQQRALNQAIEQRDAMALKAQRHNDYWIYANKVLQQILDGVK